MAGVLEERGVERLLHGNALACGAASFVIRTANTFLGACLRALARGDLVSDHYLA